MLTFDLNTIKQYSPTSSGGGLDFGGQLKSIAGSIIPGADAVIGVVDKLFGGVDKLFGGVDYATDVEPVINQRINNRINHVKNTILSNSSYTPAQALTLADASLNGSLLWLRETKKEKKSAAWQKGYDVQINALESFLQSIRQSASSQFDVNIGSRDARPLNLVSYTGKPFQYRYGSVYMYGVYTPKQGVSPDLKRVQAIKPPATTQQTNYIPQTDTSGSSDNDKPMSGGLIGGIIAVVAVVIGGIIYLIKK